MERQTDVWEGRREIHRDLHQQRSAEGGFQENLKHPQGCGSSNGNGRIAGMEDAVNLVSGALTELLWPIVEKMWNERQQSSTSLGLIITPDFKNMEPKKLLEEFLRLSGEESQ